MTLQQRLGRAGMGALAVGMTSSAVEWACCLASGFRLRTDVGVLLTASVVGTVGVTAVLAAPSLLVERRGRWLGAVALPWILVAWNASRDPSTSTGALAAAVGFGLLAVAIIEWKRLHEASVLGVSAALLTAACVGAVVAPTPWSPRVIARAKPASKVGPDVVIVVLDTLRADHLKAWGYGRETMPWLERFASGATVYERAVSATSWTLPSHATLFTGLLPETHGADITDRVFVSGVGADARAWPLPESASTLAERLRDRGYATGGVCANVGYLNRVYGLAQGFDEYVDAVTYRNARPLGLRLLARLSPTLFRMTEANGKVYRIAAEISGPALDWWRRQDGKSKFLFLNFMEAHGPNYAEPPYRHAFPLSFSAVNPDFSLFEGGRKPFTPAMRDQVIDAYDAELLALDARLELLFRELGDLSDALVIITSDHGESFGEHDFVGHGRTLTEPELHIPMVVRFPGQTQGRRVAEPVHLADLFPTTLQVAGLDVPDGVYGRSLMQDPGERGLRVSLRRPKFVVDSLPERRDHQMVGWRRGPWKLEVWLDGTARLFNLESDPGEEVDLASSRPEIVSAMRAELDAGSVEIPPPIAPNSAEAAGGDGDLLKALGYLE